MVELIFDKVNFVEIGRTAIDHVTITNVLAFAYRIITVEEGMVLPISVINDQNPSGVHHSHKYYEMLMVLDSDWLSDDGEPGSRWAYNTIGGAVPGQTVNAADDAYAIDENGVNTAIEWFNASVREHDGTATVLDFAAVTTNTVYCVGETTEFSNEDGSPHQTVTFRFIGLGDLL